MHLHILEVGDRHRIQTNWINHATVAQVTGDIIQQLVLLKLLLLLAPQQNNHVSFLIDILIQIHGIEYSAYIDAVIAWFRLDHICFDINPLEETRVLNFFPAQNIRLGDWDDAKCYLNTSFSSSVLREIYNHFGLEHVANQDGIIRVPTGGRDSRGALCHYRIDAQEMFLFFMTRCKTGFTIENMVNRIFGGYYNRWTYGWRWILFYIDTRYSRILGHQGLLRFRGDFQRFFEVIENYVKTPKWHINVDGERWWSPGLSQMPYRIAFFVDCKIYRTNVPFSGPDGNYVGAPRKRRYATTQEAFYTGHRSRHGLKVETLYLPNGISFVFGPVSCRHHDSSGGASLLDMSGLNRFLERIQHGHYNPPFAAMGDAIYGVNLECIRTYFQSYFPPAQRTEFMRICDAEMKACRQGIEWDYGRNGNVFKISTNPDNFKLAKSNPVSDSDYECLLLRIIGSHAP
jgi:hypothetical protein